MVGSETVGRLENCFLVALLLMGFQVAQDAAAETEPAVQTAAVVERSFRMVQPFQIKPVIQRPCLLIDSRDVPAVKRRLEALPNHPAADPKHMDRYLYGLLYGNEVFRKKISAEFMANVRAKFTVKPGAEYPGYIGLVNLIPATIQLSGDVIQWLGISTLSFSQDNLAELLCLLDAGKVRAVSFHYSAYFRGIEKDACARLTAELQQRGGEVLAYRNHAKLILMDMARGDGFTAESSANLRSCRNVETAAFTNDAALLDFHRTWRPSLSQKAIRG
jgi:hypothetical protein